MLGWVLFDRIIAEVDGGETINPWRRGGPNGMLEYQPDYATLCRLLAVPLALDADSTTGVPALALDVWTAYELRRAGFDEDAVWPRCVVPRILPATLAQLLRSGTRAEKKAINDIVRSGKTYGGAISASANILGKNYVKQVDVVISAWNTGPELLISTKRMDSSIGNNAANRVEESYGDANNLRSRYPQAALGFVYALRSTAFGRTERKALWLIDLLGKLGREDDAYDAVALIVPQYTKAGEEKSAANADESDPDDRLGAAGLEPADSVMEEELALLVSSSAASPVEELMSALPEVALLHDKVPAHLSPGAFFHTMITRVLDNCPITFHEDARRRREEAE